MPWEQLRALIDPFYPKPQGAGRPPMGLDLMLRIYLLQHWFQLSDPGVEDELHDSKVLEGLLHGEETRVWGGSAYAGQRAVMVRAAPSAQDFTQKRRYKNRPLSKTERQRNRTKSRVRARV